MAHRIEKDALGELPVPSDAYHGVQTERAVQNFPISGTRLPGALNVALLQIKLAAARVNQSLGVLDKRLARAIADACEMVLVGELGDPFVVDAFQAGAGTSQHMNVNEVLANLANELLGGKRGEYKPVHPNDHVNLGQSTNDVVPAAVRMAALADAGPLDTALGALVDALRERAKAFDGIVKSGRTHLADAAPIRLGQEVGAWANALAGHRSRLARACEELSVLGIGGSAVGTGLNCPPGYRAGMVKELSRITGRSFRGADDYFEAMQSAAPLVELSGVLRGLALELIRICNDVRLLASGPLTGLGELLMPAVQPGSSIMPGKVNPVMAEMLTMVCFDVVGRDTTVALAAQAGQLELNVMMPVIAYALLPAEKHLAQGIAAFTERGVRGLEADVERCAHYAQQSPQLVTALAPRLGYARAAELAKQAVAQRRTVKSLAVEQGLLTAQEAERLLDPKPLTEPEVRE
ncbi:MAG: aspartate ammonia-lyase [Deltaproteobacteria bacterium]|nr:aspartate ammonia-lyase [Deltaproteobacteria bacterium]